MTHHVNIICTCLHNVIMSDDLINVLVPQLDCLTISCLKCDNILLFSMCLGNLFHMNATLQQNKLRVYYLLLFSA